MPRNGKTTRERILAAAYRCFYQEGFQRVSVDSIAAEANVTKKTLYYHFPSKDALAGAVLEDQTEHSLGLIKEALASDETDPVQAVRKIFEHMRNWARRSGWCGSGFTRIALELAELPGHPARVAAKAHKRLVEDTLAHKLEQQGTPQPNMLARQIVMLIEGALVLMLIRGNYKYAEDAANAAEVLIRGAGAGNQDAISHKWGNH